MRLRSIIAALLCFVMVFGMIGCAGELPQETTAPETFEDTDPLTDAPDTDIVTEPETTEEPDPGIPAGQRLIFFEDFEKRSLSDNTDSVLANLGWVRDKTANGAYTNNTTDYAIVSKDGSKQLYLKNNKQNGTDSYVKILSSEVMGIYHEKNYTYQYDVNYESSSDAARYIVLVSEYNGQFYNSFHLRNNGSANNECHDGGAWLTYDTAGELFAASKDGNAICKKLLGVNYSDSAKPLQGLSISIRYVVDWEAGNSVYLRLNTEGYPNTGKWILVSKGTSSTKLDPDKGGAAIVLKTGSKINGYVDNIIIWEGTGEEPEDKSAPLVSAKSRDCSGHSYIGSGTCADPNICRYCEKLADNNKGHDFAVFAGTNDKRCRECLGFESSIESGWLLTKLPEYTGGTRARSLYLAGHGIKDAEFKKQDDSLMQIVAKTNEAQFSDYCKLLVSYGAKEVYNYTCDGNIYYQYDFHGEAYVYTYYTASVKEVRIIYDNQSECTPQDFGYTYQKKAGDTTVFYQYGVPMQDGAADDSKKINHGHIYAMKLADNSVLIIDGGGYQQFNDAQADGFMKFLRDITGTPSGQKVKISGWYISHGHQDHMAGVCLFVKKYHNEVDFDRIFFNFPTKNSDVGVFITTSSTHANLIGYLDKYLRDDDVKYIKLHTGQNFELADVKIKVIYTHEDLVDPITASSKVANDYNNSCSVIKIEFDGKSLLFLGDVNKPAMNVFVDNNSAQTLKSDAVQLAHHVFNDLAKLYDIVKAPVVFSPQSYYGATLDSARKKTLDSALKYVENDMVFYANVATYGIEVKDGKFVKTFERPTINVQYTGWGW